MIKYLRIRIAKNMHERIAAEAAKQERSMSWLAAKYIEKGLAEDLKIKAKK